MIRDDAYRWFTLGLAVIPIRFVKEEGKKDGKKPLLNEKVKWKWQQWEIQQQTLEEFESLPWEQADCYVVVCGTKANNGLYFCGLDFDNEVDFNKLDETLQNAYREKTHSGGFHIPFWSTVPTKTDRTSYKNFELLGSGSLMCMYSSAVFDSKLLEVVDAEKVFQQIAKALNVERKTLLKVSIDKPIEELLANGVAEGERDNTAIFHASKLRQAGFGKDDAIACLLKWNLKNDVPLPERDIFKIVNSAYKNAEPYFKEKKKKQYKKRAFSVKTQTLIAESLFENEEPKFLCWNDSNFELADKLNDLYPKTLARTFDSFLFSIPKNYDLQKKPNAQELFYRIKDIITRYVDIPKEIVVMVTLMIFLSYLQGRFALIPYCGIYGDTGTGKTVLTNLMAMMCFHGYFAVSINSADIYNIINTYGKGNVTLFEDEVQGLEKDTEKVKIYKSGNRYDSSVPRIVNDVLRKFPTYCFKVLNGEQKPQVKGLEERTLTVESTKGIPQSCFEKDRLSQEFIEKIQTLKIDLLKWKMLNEKTPLETFESKTRFESNLMPLRAIAKGLLCNSEFENWCEEQIKLSEQRKKSTLEGCLSEILQHLIENKGFKYEPLENNITITFKAIWEKVPDFIEGQQDRFHYDKFNSVDFGELTKHTIGSKLSDVFHCETRGRRVDKEYFKVKVFNVDILLKALSNYLEEEEIETLKTKIKTGKEYFETISKGDSE
jgi:hypothetical protein